MKQSEPIPNRPALWQGVERHNFSSYDCYLSQTDVSGNTAEVGPYRVVLGAPDVTPEAPTIVSTEVGDGEIILTVMAGAGGGSAIERYDATCRDANDNEYTGSSTTTQITVDGLSNDTAYSCTVTATNVDGYTSVASGGSGTLTPEALPNGLPAWLLYEASKP